MGGGEQKMVDCHLGRNDETDINQNNHLSLTLD